MLNTLLALTLVAGLDADLAFCAKAEKSHDGDIVLTQTKDAAGNKGVRTCAYVGATTMETYQTLIDYASFPQWMDKVEKVGVKWVDAEVALVDYHLDTIAGDFKYQLRRVHQPGRRVDWSRVSGDFKMITGIYTFVPIEGTQASYLIHESYVDPGKAIPGFIESYFRDKGAKQLIEDIRDEIGRRRKGK